jgi:hypothetical protein
MAVIEDLEVPLLQFAEAAAPSTPASGLVRIYAKADGLLYSKDDAGTETALGGGGGGGSVTVTEYEASADTTLTVGATDYDVAGCTVSLAAGTYLVTAHVQFEQTSGGAGQNFGAAIVSGGTRVREGSSVYAASWVAPISLSKKLVLGSTTTVKVQARAQNGGDKVKRYDPVYGDSVIATVMTVIQTA